jgi:hypothetical protein
MFHQNLEVMSINYNTYFIFLLTMISAYVNIMNEIADTYYLMKLSSALSMRIESSSWMVLNNSKLERTWKEGVVT